MKTLNSFTNVDKAKLIHALFIHEIPGFLADTLKLAEFMRTQPDEIRKVWKNQLFGVDFWLQLAMDSEKKIKQYGKQLEKSSPIFADQLFDGYGALFLHHCLVTYTEQSKHHDPKFKTAVELFFNP